MRTGVALTRSLSLRASASSCSSDLLPPLPLAAAGAVSSVGGGGFAHAAQGSEGKSRGSQAMSTRAVQASWYMSLRVGRRIEGSKHVASAASHGPAPAYETFPWLPATAGWHESYIAGRGVAALVRLLLVVLRQGGVPEADLNGEGRLGAIVLGHLELKGELLARVNFPVPHLTFSHTSCV